MPMKDTLNIDGRIYISSRRAAEISKYSNDYVGQLCRGGKVPARMMGRTWFVDQEALLEHKRAAEEALRARSRAGVYTYAPAAVQEAAQAAPAEHIPAAPAVPHTATSATADADVKPFLPVLEKRIPAMPVARIPTERAGSIGRQAGYSELVRSVILRRVISTVAVVTIIVSGGFVTSRSGLTELAQFNGVRQMATEQVVHGTASALDAAARFFDGVRSAYGTVVAFFADRLSGVNRKLARGVPESSVAGKVGDSSAPATSIPWNGIAVVSSDPSTDAVTEQRIKDSFSDPVTIRPGESGTSGVITPVFKETSGDGFLYVLVPVEGEETTNDAAANK